MKDARFVELVNLYIDRQIAPEEAAELEAEIQASPRRRALYREYCQMHRATKLVYDSFRAHADVQIGGAAEPGSIAYFAQRRSRVRRTFWLSTAAGLAAAVAVAFHFVRPEAGPSVPLAGTPAPAAKVAVAAPQPMAPAPAKAVAQPDYAALLASLRQAQPRTYAISPAPAVAPVSLFDDGVFDHKQPTASGANGMTLSKGASKNQTAEVTAFQFQR